MHKLAIVPLVVRVVNEDHVLFGGVNCKLAAHAVKGEAAVLSHPDEVSVTVGVVVDVTQIAVIYLLCGSLFHELTVNKLLAVPFAQICRKTHDLEQIGGTAKNSRVGPRVTSGAEETVNILGNSDLSEKLFLKEIDKGHSRDLFDQSAHYKCSGTVVCEDCAGNAQIRADRLKIPSHTVLGSGLEPTVAHG